MEKDNKGSKGLGLGTILFLIFLTLKLGGWGVVATWSWWWVFSPLWIPLSLIGILVLIAYWLDNR
jgi:ABC-type antimicrobial peptide transport system permease subunit